MEGATVRTERLAWSRSGQQHAIAIAAKRCTAGAGCRSDVLLLNLRCRPKAVKVSHLLLLLLLQLQLLQLLLLQLLLLQLHTIHEFRSVRAHRHKRPLHLSLKLATNDPVRGAACTSHLGRRHARYCLHCIHGHDLVYSGSVPRDQSDLLWPLGCCQLLWHRRRRNWPRWQSYRALRVAHGLWLLCSREAEAWCWLLPHAVR
mmetsp:Transcript_73543/g.118664  ORF Transcript_73543/g.118664 Transcript_73543/m.118664 type:complete len:202 (-) Transcript_73543:1681-2286(-)